MTLPASGAISFGDVNTELGLSATAQISLNDAAVRTLFGIPSGAISLNTGHGKSAITYVSGTLSGSGTLAIHAGATSVSLVGHGGVGYNDYWYDGGQAYIAPTGYHAAVTGYETWGAPYSPAGGVQGPSSPSATPYAVPYSDPGGSGSMTTAINGTGIMASTWQVFAGGFYSLYGQAYWMTQLSVVPTTAAYYDNPGQEYIAPSEGGGDQAGPYTLAQLNGGAVYWWGGSGYVVGATSTQTLTGAGMTMSYTVCAGGALSYSYSY